MSFYGGKRDTWKIVYFLPSNQWNNGNRGVALIEAGDHQHAMNQFMTQYRGQYSCIESCTKLLG
jgi:hypothetical protein